MPLAEAEKWLDHLTSCSPCYSDFSQFQAANQRRRTRTILAIAASILIVAGLASWALVAKHTGTLIARTVMVDLRNRSVARGTEANPGELPLEVSRGATQWNIYLPLGSSEGPYDVRIVTLGGEMVLSTNGTARLDDHITSLQVMVNYPAARAGQYLLQVRKSGSDWNSYPILLR
jgi:hypothetical protein